MFTANLYLILLLSSSIISRISSSQNSTDIESMIEDAEKTGLAVTYNVSGRTFPLLFNPLATALSTLTAISAIKIGLIYSVTMWLLSLFVPQWLQLLGLTTGLIAKRNSRESLISEVIQSIDLESISKTVQVVPEKLAQHLHIPEQECRYRAVCESATYIATKMPLINDWVKKVSGALFLNLANPYSRAWINGMMKIDCNATYLACGESPFKTLLNKVTLRRR